MGEMNGIKKISRAFTIVGLVLAMSVSAYAQGTAPEQRARPSGGPRRQLATILFAGLGGAVLGLSTLSFYGRPQEKLSNIAIGFAFGVIGGTTYVTYKAATGPSEFYGSPQSQMESEWMSTNKMATAASVERGNFALSFEF